MESPPARPVKTVLGRGLGNLLGAEAPPPATAAMAAAATSAAAEVPKVAAPLTPGVGALLRGGNGRGATERAEASRENSATATVTATATAPTQAAMEAAGRNLPTAVTSAPPAAPSSGRSLKLPLLVADLLLLGLVGVLLLRGDGRPGVLELGLGLVAVGVGAWLGCLAFLSSRRRE